MTLSEKKLFKGLTMAMDVNSFERTMFTFLFAHNLMNLTYMNFSTYFTTVSRN